MKAFAELVYTLGAATGSGAKQEALAQYFSMAGDQDTLWAIALLNGRRPRRMVSAVQLQSYCAEASSLPQWLLDECFTTVGDIAETIALLLPANHTETNAIKPLHYYTGKMQELEKAPEAEKKAFILQQWKELGNKERFIFNKLITGGFRITVTQKIMARALARALQLEPGFAALCISYNFDPAVATFTEIFHTQTNTDHSRPYPFHLANYLEGSLQVLGEPDEWQAEWKWDGIRAQIIKRNNQLFIWSRSEELLTEKLPEFHSLSTLLPEGTVLDGEIVVYKDGQALPFTVLQTRLGRKNISRQQLQSAPAGFIAYDLLELDGQDKRPCPLSERRTALEELVNNLQFPCLQLSPVITFNNWNELAHIHQRARSMNSEGIMLKQKSSVYCAGRSSNHWFKWKNEPLTIDAVLVYVQKGNAPGSNGYIDFTFAVKDSNSLVTFTKTAATLSEQELTEVDDFVKNNTLEKFGPVRTIKAELVFEIGFEGIVVSNRHKCGFTLRAPRIHRWRTDKKVADINTIEDLRKMLGMYGR